MKVQSKKEHKKIEKKEEGKKRKSCPRCAKWNRADSKSCISCGYSFVNKKNLWVRNLLYTFLFICVLFFFAFFGKEEVFFHISFFLKLGAFFLFLGIIISIFSYGNKEKITYSAEEDMVKRNLSFFKKVSFKIVILGVFLFALFFFFFIKTNFFK